MWSPAVRSLYMNGPTQTGFWAKFAPPLAIAAGERIIPERSASCAVNGENGADRCSVTVLPDALIEATEEISLLRTEPGNVRYRSSVSLTAAPVRGLPSLNLIPLRILIV